MLCKGSCNADSLLLSTGKSNSALSDDRLIFVIQLFDKVCGLSIMGSLLHLGACDFISKSHLNVLRNRIGKQKDILHHHRRAASQLSQGKLSDIYAIQFDASFRCVIKSLEQIDDGGFSGAGSPHDTKGFSCRNRKRNILKDFFVFQAKVHMLKAHIALYVI